MKRKIYVEKYKGDGLKLTDSALPRLYHLKEKWYPVSCHIKESGVLSDGNEYQILFIVSKESSVG